MKRPLTRSPKGIKTEVEFQEDGSLTGLPVFTETQAVGKIADFNNAMDNHVRQSATKGHVHVAEIPIAVVNQLMRDGIWQDKDRLTKWLNDPDNRAWRTDRRRL